METEDSKIRYSIKNTISSSKQNVKPIYVYKTWILQGRKVSGWVMKPHAECQWPLIHTKLIIWNIGWYITAFNAKDRAITSSLMRFVAICLLGRAEGAQYGRICPFIDRWYY